MHETPAVANPISSFGLFAFCATAPSPSENDRGSSDELRHRAAMPKMWSDFLRNYLTSKWIACILLLLTITHSTDILPRHKILTRGKKSITDFLTAEHISVGGRSRCISGHINLTVTSQNFKISYAEPSNQLAATEFIVELLQVDSTLAQRLIGDSYPITGTYGIYSSLCVPISSEAARKVETVQFLTHGDTLSGRYWDIAPGYSYVDAVTTAGQAAFFYDRIGVGKSDHPDSIQVVQGPLQVEIAHALVELLRTNQVGNFSNVVGVGHSAGSTVTQGVTTKYPDDFDAIILTGITTSTTYLPLTIASSNFQIANQASKKFRDLSNGYITQANEIGVQYAYFRYPNFDPTS